MYTPLDYVVHLELARSTLSRSGQERFARLAYAQESSSAHPASPRTGGLLALLRLVRDFATGSGRATAKRGAAPAPCCPSAA